MMKNKDQQFIKGMGGVFDVIADARTHFLREMLNLRAVKLTLNKKEYSRLESKFGEAYPRTLTAGKKLRSDAEFFTAIARELEMGSIRTPPVGDGEMLVDGRIVDENGRGVHGLTVTVADAQGRRLPEFGTATTDQFGYYAFLIPSSVVEGRTELNQDGILVQVATPVGQVIQTSPEPIKLRAGVLSRSVLTVGRRMVGGGSPVYTAPRGQPGPVRYKAAPPRPNATTEDIKAPAPDTTAFGGDPGTYVVHGHVVDRSGKTLLGHAIAALDEQGRPVVEGKTDETGYFRLVFRVVDNGPPESVSRSTRRAKGRSSGRKRGAAHEAAIPGTAVRLRISDAGGTAVVLDDQPQAVTPGGVMYRDIVIG